MQQLKAPTNMVWILGRTQVNSREDGKDFVVPLQNQYRLSPLSMFGKSVQPVAAEHDSILPSGDPNTILRNMPAAAFFNYLNRLMVDNPPAPADAEAISKVCFSGV